MEGDLRRRIVAVYAVKGRAESAHKRTAVIPTIVTNHKHDLPLKDIVVHQTARDAR